MVLGSDPEAVRGATLDRGVARAPGPSPDRSGGRSSASW